MTVSIDRITADEFSLKNAVLEIHDINQAPAKISLQSERLDSCLSAFELHIKIKHALGYCQAFKGKPGL
jgi:hypothetical protein